MNKLIFTVLILGSQLALSQDIDYIKLAQALIKDGNYQRGQTALSKAKLEWEDIDHDKYYLLDGLLKIRSKKIKAGINSLNKVSDIDLFEKKYAYLAEAYLTNSELKQAKQWVDKIKISKKSAKSLVFLKAKIYFENNLFPEAFQILEVKHLQSNLKAKQIIIHYLLQIGLYLEASSYMEKVASEEKSPSLYIKFSKILLSKDEYNKALTLLETASLRFPDSPELVQLLVATYDLKKMKNVAGDLYIKLAYIDTERSFAAAEYLHQTGKTKQAMVMNMVVNNPKKQISQKLGIYIDQERYDLASSLETSIRQYGVYKDDKVKYAMAYTYLKQGHYDSSLKLLKDIKNQKLISKSVKLMDLVHECKKSNWECYGTL